MHPEAHGFPPLPRVWAPQEDGAPGLDRADLSSAAPAGFLLLQAPRPGTGATPGPSPPHPREGRLLPEPVCRGPADLATPRRPRGTSSLPGSPGTPRTRQGEAQRDRREDTAAPSPPQPRCRVPTARTGGQGRGSTPAAAHPGESLYPSQQGTRPGPLQSQVRREALRSLPRGRAAGGRPAAPSAARRSAGRSPGPLVSAESPAHVTSQPPQHPARAREPPACTQGTASASTLQPSSPGVSRKTGNHLQLRRRHNCPRTRPSSPGSASATPGPTGGHLPTTEQRAAPGRAGSPSLIILGLAGPALPGPPWASPHRAVPEPGWAEQTRAGQLTTGLSPGARPSEEGARASGGRTQAPAPLPGPRSRRPVTGEPWNGSSVRKRPESDPCLPGRGACCAPGCQAERTD